MPDPTVPIGYDFGRSLTALGDDVYAAGASAMMIKMTEWLLAEGEHDLAGLALKLPLPVRGAPDKPKRTDGILTFQTPRASLPWRAYFEDRPDTHFGMGDTEASAIEDLREMAMAPGVA